MMTKKEYCLSHGSIAYYSGLGGLEIKGIEYEADGYCIYCVSGAWAGCKAYHRLKICFPESGGDGTFFRLHGYRIPLNECIRMGV